MVCPTNQLLTILQSVQSVKRFAEAAADKAISWYWRNKNALDWSLESITILEAFGMRQRSTSSKTTKHKTAFLADGRTGLARIPTEDLMPYNQRGN